MLPYHSLPDQWKTALHQEFKKEYFVKLCHFLEEEKFKLPPAHKIFSALELCKPSEVKVVILGQDPYHKSGQANGLAFSVNEDTKIPPSLRNIYKEIQNDLGLSSPTHGDLEQWARQGVLLLNTVLSVRESEAGSHQGKGWEKLTDAIINYLSEKNSGIVFLLWGKKAQKKAELIDQQKHHILSANHPSPLSSYRGFFGCRHFSKTNALLIQEGKTPIDWQIS